MSKMRQKIRQEFLPIDKAMRKELDAILTPEQRKRLEERFVRRGPGGFFRPPGGRPPHDRPPGDKPPGPPWPGEKPPQPPPWLKKEPKQKEKTEESGEVQKKEKKVEDGKTVVQ